MPPGLVHCTYVVEYVVLFWVLMFVCILQPKRTRLRKRPVSEPTVAESVHKENVLSFNILSI